MSDVFVSYKRENLAAVGRLVEALRAAGIGVWWDQDIPPNAAWEATIEQALAAAKLVIVAWSPASVASENVKAEARWARTQGRLLQVFVEACEPPLFFGERQGVDLKGWTGAASDAAFRAVLEAVRAELKASSRANVDRDPPGSITPSENAPPPLPSKPSISVMPFANLSGDADQDYFADGMVVEITNALSRFKSIFVIASSSTLSFKGKTVGARDAARQLGVRYVLEGSVRKAGNRVRVAVQLIDATDGAQIWTDRFEDTIEDVFALQDKVALSVAGKIEPTLHLAEVQRASARGPENMNSYDLCLRALSLQRSLERADLLAALDLVNRAIALDPDYGSALALVGVIETAIVTLGWSSDPEASRRHGAEAARRALKFVGDDAHALAWAGFAVAILEPDLGAGVALLDRAIALNPGCAAAWYISGVLRLRTGEIDLAVTHIETSMRLDPMGPNRSAQLNGLATARFQQRRFGEAAALAKESVERYARPNGYSLLAASLGQLGQTRAAMDALTRARSLTPLSMEASAQLFFPDPTHLKLFLDGIALAEGKSPFGGPADAQP